MRAVMGRPRSEPPVASERAEVVALLEWLARSGPPVNCWYSVIPGGDGRETRAPGFVAGTPDMVFVVRGKVVFLEMKRVRGGRLAAAQMAVHERITLAGGLVLIACGWQDAAEQLRLLIPFRTRIEIAA
jgi:hypothetical protein